MKKLYMKRYQEVALERINAQAEQHSSGSKAQRKRRSRARHLMNNQTSFAGKLA